MKSTGFKRLLALAVAVCMAFSCLILPQVSADAATEVTVYFLNSEGWASVNAYAYNTDTADALGGWPGTVAEPATELGGDWLKVTVPSAPDFNVIFFNSADESQRVDSYFGSADAVYATMKGVYDTQAEAEADMAGSGSGSEETEGATVYFYNADGWAEVYGYNWGGPGEVLGGWPGTKATDEGDGWWKLEIPADATAASFNLIFNNNAGLQAPDAVITRNDNNYVAVVDGATVIYTSREEAETALGVAATPTVYFYNADSWTEVYGYVWGDAGEVLGGWPGTKATEVSGNWWKISIDADATVASLNLIFNNNAGNQVPDAVITQNGISYVAVIDGVTTIFDSQADAEAALGITEAPSATVYFYNADGWTEVYGYNWGGPGEVLGGWPGTAATDEGDGWWKLEIPADATAANFNLIFNNNAGSQAQDAVITRNNNNYVAVVDGVTTVYPSRIEAEIALGLTTGTTVYFLNSSKWAEIGAYVYNSTPAEALGGWGTSSAVAAPEVGDDWFKVTVPAATPFNIIFYNKAADAERAELQIPSADKVYVTVASLAFASADEAEASLNATPTTIYFLNWDGEKTVFTAPTAYVYGDSGEAAGGWPGLQAVSASHLGDNWWQVEIPANASVTPFNVIFSDNGANQIANVYITNYTNNYITAAGDGVLYTSQTAAEASVGITYETVVYYLNSEGWANIGAYVYGACGEALGSWPGKDVEAAPELGENWVKVTVPAKPAFSIIFFNKDDPDPERAELQLTSDKQVYVAGCKTHSSPAAYGSQLEAELAMGLGDSSLMTALYFYNSRGWGSINGYVYREEDGVTVTVGAGWPGTACEPAGDVGENWWKLLVPRTPTAEDPFYVVFNDGVNQTQTDILIDDTENIYVTVTCKTFPTAAEAEAEAANDDYDDGCEEGPNTDIDDYDVTYDGAGANLPYITYEAENAITNAEVLEKDTLYRNSIQTEASGRQAVKLNGSGDYVEFTLTEAANALVLRYAMPDSADGTGIDASLSLYVDGTEVTDLALTSSYAWVYGGYPFNNNPSNGMAHRFFDETRLLLDETLPAGTTIRLQKDTADAAEYYVIDFIECELVGAPLTQPEGSLSVTDFGAVANDGQDDRAAFEAAIAAAREQGREVWIPVGTFDLVEEKALTVSGVTIRGAGMWYTNLYGAGAAFKYEGTSKFFDFAMTGVSTVRDDSGDLAGFEGTGSRATNITIENIWMEHMKVGVWSANTYRMAIQGCRIRNTYADGINLCSGTHDSIVRNNSVRNTGDDAIASWPWLADCSGNTVSHNTIQVPTLANGVAIYGGGDVLVEGNHVMDTINNGAGIVIGSEFDTAMGYTGTVTVRDNLLDRCGSMQSDENYPIGAIWIWSSWSPMTTEYLIYNNVMNDCVKEGILIEVNSELTGLNIQHNTVSGATNAVYEYLNGPGSGKVGNMTVSNLTDVEYKDNAPNFTLEHVDEDIGEDKPVPEIIASGWSGDTTWTLTSDGVLTFSGNGVMRKYYEKYKTPWDAYREQVTSVVIEEGVTRISAFVFYGMTNLTSVSIPGTVTEIGDYAFKGCTSLTSITLPASVKTLGDSVFYKTALTGVVIPAGVTSLGEYAFGQCADLREVEFTGSAPAIGFKAFSKVTATVWYPAGDDSWTSVIAESFGGTLTWKSK